MNTTATLKDGTTLVIRDLTLEDLDKLMDFYRSLPDEDRRYLKVNVTDRDVVKERLLATKSSRVFRLIALLGDRIAADGTLELGTDDWRRHQGELRLIVAEPYRRRGVGMAVMRELYHLAVSQGVELAVAKIMRPQAAAQSIFRRLGFREELLLPDYVRDQAGEKQDLIIMTADIKAMWREIESFTQDSDWQRSR